MNDMIRDSCHGEAGAVVVPEHTKYILTKSYRRREGEEKGEGKGGGRKREHCCTATKCVGQNNEQCLTMFVNGWITFPKYI